MSIEKLTIELEKQHFSMYEEVSVLTDKSCGIVGLPDRWEIRDCPGILPLVPCLVISAYCPGF